MLCVCVCVCGVCVVLNPIALMERAISNTLIPVSTLVEIGVCCDVALCAYVCLY